MFKSSLFNRVRRTLNKLGGQLKLNSIYFTEHNGRPSCCAIGAVAITVCGVEAVRHKGRREVMDMVKQSLGWDEDDLLSLESGFEGDYIATIATRPDKYELGQKFRNLALAV